LLRYGMEHSFQKNHHLNANLKIHQTQKAGPVIKLLLRQAALDVVTY